MNNRSLSKINHITKTISATCNHCGSVDDIPYSDATVLAEWLDRKIPTQTAFPNVEPARRELLISGTCGECWNKMFGDGI